MRRITGANVATDLFGAGKHGFKERVAGVSAPTLVTSQFTGDLQEEVCNTIEGFGFNLGTSSKQLLNVARCAAIETAIVNHAPRAPANAFSGFLWCTATSSSGRLVIGGGSGEIQTSDDGGATWIKRTQAGPFNGSFSGMAYSSSLGLFVVVGSSGEIQTSPDGTTWTKRTQAGAYAGNFAAAAFGAGLFVIVGTAGEIQTSPDGTTWTKRTQAGSFAGVFYNASFGGSLFVVSGSSGEIQTSSDGSTWTKRTQAGGFNSNFFGAAYGNGLFIVAGSTGEIQSSPNGIDWTRRMPATWTPQIFLAIAARDSSEQGGAYFLAVGSNGVMAISADGLDWRLLHRPTRFSSHIYGARYHPATSTFLAVGQPGFIRQTLAI